MTNKNRCIVEYTSIDKKDGTMHIMRASSCDEKAARNIVHDTAEKHREGLGIYGEMDFKLTIEKNGKIIHTETSLS